MKGRKKEDKQEGGSGGRLEGCGGGRDGATDQYPHLTHLSAAHLKNIWTGFLKTVPEERLLGVRSFGRAQDLAGEGCERGL